MNTILIATDFSPAAKSATDYAATLAGVLHARLYLLHIYMMPAPVSEIPYNMVNAAELQSAAEIEMAGELSRLAGTHGLQVEPIVTMGIPFDEIVFQAGEKNADMIIMGMKGSSGIDKFLGSTTISVSRKSKVPVLVIPTDCVYKPWHTITFATDYQFHQYFSGFFFLNRFMEPFEARLQIVHVRKPGEAPDQATAEAKRVMDERLQDIPHEYFTIEHEDVTQGIELFLRDHPSEVLSMAAHKHNFFERLFVTEHTKQMLYKTDIPLLILQDKP